MYIGHARLCPSVPRRIPALMHVPVCNLGEWYGMPSSCALLGGFAIGARVSLLRQHGAERETSASACTRSMPGSGERCDGRTERKGKEEYLYSAFLHQGTHKALRHGSHSFTCKQHHACLSFVSVHQMSPPQQLRQQTSNCSSVLIY